MESLTRSFPSTFSRCLFSNDTYLIAYRSIGMWMERSHPRGGSRTVVKRSRLRITRDDRVTNLVRKLSCSYTRSFHRLRVRVVL